MPLKVAVQMDPVEGINIDTDTTFLMMMEAQARGHSLWVYTPDTLALEDGRVIARGRGAEPARGQGRPPHARASCEVRDLAEMDVVLMRQDPPFDMAYITATHFLETIHPEDPGGEQPGRGAQRAGEAVRHRLSRACSRRP